MNAAGRGALALPLLLPLLGCPGFGEREGPGGLVVEIPPDPVYDDVAPVLAAYCFGCHTDPPRSGAPGNFRLDLCEDTEVLGARSLSPRIVARVAESPAAPMPPFGPGPRDLELELLRVWEASGAPCD